MLEESFDHAEDDFAQRQLRRGARRGRVDPARHREGRAPAGAAPRRGRARGDRPRGRGAARRVRGQRPQPHPRPDRGAERGEPPVRAADHGRVDQGRPREQERRRDRPMKHKVTFLPKNVTVEVDDTDFPYGDHGKPGLAPRHRARERHRPRAQLRRQLRLHDLPRDRPRGGGEPLRDGRGRGRQARPGAGLDAILAARLPVGRHGRRHRRDPGCLIA